jgi:hypothetical protein
MEHTVYADDVNYCAKHNMMKSSIKALSDTTQETRIEMNTDKSKYYMLMPHHQNAEPRSCYKDKEIIL